MVKGKDWKPCVYALKNPFSFQVMEHIPSKYVEGSRLGKRRATSSMYVATENHSL